MRAIIDWLARFFGGLAAVIGAIMVGWSDVEYYYLITGRVQADFEQPPLPFVAGVLFVGVVLLIGGYLVQRHRRDDVFH